MILLSSIIRLFEREFLAQYHASILPSHLKALAAILPHVVEPADVGALPRM
jgi:hypothetical protein